MSINPCTYRLATEKDLPTILFFINELAAYEKMLDQVVATEESLRHWLFKEKKAEVLFAEIGETIVGSVLFFYNFSTFLGRAGLYMEDLYVCPQYRGHGHGRALIKKMASLTVERNCGRLEWGCFDFNTPSIDFYRSLGAESQDDWTVFRLEGATLAHLAGEQKETV